MKTSSFLSHLECSSCFARHSADELQTVCRTCGKVLLARYDLEKARRFLQPNDLLSREPTMWRYRELLPVRMTANIISLGEGMTPLIPLGRQAHALGIRGLLLKDEGSNPTSSFKARGLSAAISKASEFGIQEVLAPSAGNAGSALAAYAARAGMRAKVFLPRNTPRLIIDEIRWYGAEVRLVDGTIADAAQRMKNEGWDSSSFDCSTMKEPYRLEGKKTLGFEIAEQMGWSLPDAIIFPTGGGTGLIGMWKAFDELEQLGWIGSRRPRMIAVQSGGCAPIVRAFRNGDQFSSPWENAQTIAAGLCVPKAFADYLILKVLRESNGTAIDVEDEVIRSQMRASARSDGILLCPESAATLAALRLLVSDGFILPQETVIVLNTASGTKYTELLASVPGGT